MQASRKRRTRRLATIGSVAAIVSFISYASQNGLPGLVTGPAPDAATAITAAGAHHAGPRDRAHRRSALLRDGTAAQRQLGRAQAVEKSPQTERQVFGQHVQEDRRAVARRMPRQPPVSQWVDTAYDHASPRANVLRRPSLQATGMAAAAATTATCTSDQFAMLSGASLVAAVKGATTSCINGLFSLGGSLARDTFNEAKMVSVANALATSAGRYDGSNQDSTLQLILFLRAGYYVQYYDGSVGDYGSALRAAIRPALDAFAGNANFGLVNDVHGEILAEFVTLIDSATENARYLYVVKRLLNAFDSRYDAYYWMRAATNNAFLVLFRGHYDAAFQQAVQADTSIVDTLYDFVNRNFSLMGGENDYLVSNAGRELGRFLQYGGTLKSLSRSRAKAVIDRSAVTGVTAPLWVGVGEMVDYYDKANCSYYGLCDFAARVEAAALPLRHTCSPTLRIRAQAMSAAELAQTCQIVGGQEDYFHDRLQTGGVPVRDDNNSALEMVVFDSSTDYGTYAGAIFGIDTNNGGMYLEGDPAASGNQARFIAYEAEWLQPETFEIWNLTHEYVHYLDGRFNMHGDFGDAISQDTIWWIEGLAEYMSYSYRDVLYAAAQQEAAKGTHALSTIYGNDYNSGQTRVYNWGYLAVRYMFEQRRGQVDSILGYLRPGDYAGYAGFMASIGTGNDAGFKAWLPCVATPGTPSCGGSGNTPPVAAFSASATGLTARFTDGSSDPDGRIVSRRWSFGDGSSSTAASPSHTYASAGSYTVQLTVTDDAGASSSTSRSVSVSAGTPNQAPSAAFSVAVDGLAARFTDASTDPDGRIVSRAWDFGDGSGSTTTSPSHAYASAGTYTVALTVTDDAGATHTRRQAVTVSGGADLPACAGSAQAMGRNCSRTVSVAAGDHAYLYIYIPQGTASLRITMKGGTGNADLFVNTLGNWATRTSHNYRSTNAGNSESVVVDHPPAGYVYLSLYGVTAANGVTVSTEY
ncbi:collagenase [Marilutibacter spongiae]|uniref:microbial collagenase n=1 Tax=Marilutibacter spongiae TaxID=2025720 RepID=A0A7W3TIU6_9GAMM|nr:collagenase [Lysobacter spongiae]MBB1059141.1 collagenase [Lysobacter spongiae]